MNQTDWKAVREQLLRSPRHGCDRLSEADRTEMAAYCAAYLDFIGQAKTEREAVARAVREAEAAGFRVYDPAQPLRPGDKRYRVNRGKSVTFFVAGTKPMSEGVRFTASHIDAPRLDLKPSPLYEEQELAYFKTHYYGGIKKYQWAAVPLSLHGVLALTDGSTLTVRIGEDPADPVFCVTDLLPHLSAEQMKKSLAEGLSGEQLNILIGSTPLPGDTEEGQRIKLAAMVLLHEKYGITEEDFLSAELSLVPALPAREVGLDRSMIGAYGHDDRVCAYAGLKPLLEMTEAPEHTVLTILSDKEEVGSVGVTGLRSEELDLLMEQLCGGQGLRQCYANSVCLSIDVAAAYDPNFADVYEKRNSAMLNYGIAMFKYTGSRGKGGASDASAELIARCRRTFDRAEVCWQICELGKVDAGGAGTVAQFMADRNIDTIDAGVPVLSMHAPWEIVAKLDCFMTMKACRAFYAMS